MKITYCLLINLSQNRKIKIGKLLINFKKGHYIYIGSAPLYKKSEKIPRIERHFRKKKRMKWHIDYFLRKANIRKVIFSDKSECETAKELSKRFDGIKDFGCSDCKCRSHLFYCGEPMY